MISRRNIRVKVMQTLYSLELYNTSPSQTAGEVAVVLPRAKKLLQQHLDLTTRLFSYLLYNIAAVARYVETDARQRASKHLPTAEDLHVNTRLAANGCMLRLVEDPGFSRIADREGFRSLEDAEITKKLYLSLVASPEYKAYLEGPSKTEKEDRRILLFIFQELLSKSETFDQHTEDLFLNWPDDRDMMGILISNYLTKPAAFDFSRLISEEKQQYARELLETVLEKRDYCLEVIKPRLQNWDPDRIAAIDMLLMTMGICEFLFFPTIPTKVTINEYIDLAKTYSTPQSGQFVNGLLDNVLKDLTAAEKITKTDHVKK
jgi:N utilization substance protein B